MSQNENLFKGSIGRTYQDSQPWWPDELSARKGAPNIVIIVLDDVGFADLGCYGSEIATPCMDRLARDGVHGEFVNYAAIGIWNRPRQWYRQA